MRHWILLGLLVVAGCTGVKVNDVTMTEGHHADRLEGPVEVLTPPITRIREFHGHVGPYVVLGYRMGLLARRVLTSPGYFDLAATVESPLSPPASCLIDGLQLGSGCTAGKRNLTVREGAMGRASFSTKAGKTAVVSLRPDLPGRIKRWIDEIGVERAGLRLFDCPEDELFILGELQP